MVGAAVWDAYYCARWCVLDTEGSLLADHSEYVQLC